MAQTYAHPLALERMDQGLCPECGHVEAEHTGWGCHCPCLLTDNGVAQRIHAYRQSKENPSA